MVKIFMCSNDCMLFYIKTKYLDVCPNDESPRYKDQAQVK